jgi:hypothetical protein
MSQEDGHQSGADVEDRHQSSTDAEDGHQSSTDAEDGHQSITDAEDGHQSSADAEEATIRSSITGRLCHQVLALIKGKKGLVLEINQWMMGEVKAWLRRRGVTIYTDLE